MDQLKELNEALSDVAESFEADGYQLSVESFDLKNITLKISAKKGACKDCLVPKEILEQIVFQILKNRSPKYENIQIQVIYPVSN